MPVKRYEVLAYASISAFLLSLMVAFSCVWEHNQALRGF